MSSFYFEGTTNILFFIEGILIFKKMAAALDLF